LLLTQPTYLGTLRIASQQKTREGSGRKRKTSRRQHPRQQQPHPSHHSKHPEHKRADMLFEDQHMSVDNTPQKGSGSLNSSASSISIDVKPSMQSWAQEVRAEFGHSDEVSDRMDVRPQNPFTQQLPLRTGIQFPKQQCCKLRFLGEEGVSRDQRGAHRRRWPEDGL